MNLTYEALNIFLFLIPGFFSAIIFDQLTFRKEKDTLSKLIESLIFSFFIYSLSSFVSDNFPIILKSFKENDVTKYLIEFNNDSIVYILIFSILIPIILSFFQNRDYMMRMMRYIKITDKTARETVWIDVFTDHKKYITINFKDGRRLLGWPMYYSNNPNEGMIYLYDPSWITDKLDRIDIGIHGMLIEDKSNIDFIEFHHKVQDNQTNGGQQNE